MKKIAVWCLLLCLTVALCGLTACKEDKKTANGDSSAVSQTENEGTGGSVLTKNNGESATQADSPVVGFGAASNGEKSDKKGEKSDKKSSKDSGAKSQDQKDKSKKSTGENSSGTTSKSGLKDHTTEGDTNSAESSKSAQENKQKTEEKTEDKKGNESGTTEPETPGGANTATGWGGLTFN